MSGKGVGLERMDAESAKEILSPANARDAGDGIMRTIDVHVTNNANGDMESDHENLHGRPQIEWGLGL